MEERAVKNFDRWNAALQSGNPETVALLYSEEATLLPTMMPQTKASTTEIEGYFEMFVAQKPVATIREEHVERLSDDTYLHAGVYDFVLQESGQEVEARFSFVWRNEGGDWKILHHHSSRMPDS